MSVRTRFAPSPTGYMHMGGMRTALFAWLFARHHGGQFILRIDDTDRARHVDAALQPILRAFTWLGLTWDEGPEVGGPFGPYFQSQRGDKYARAVDQLLASGRAYRDFDTPEVTKADRDAAEREKRPYLNLRRSLELSAAEQQARLDRGEPFVIRLLVPREQHIVIDDGVRGRVEFDAGLMPDPVIVRGDGSPLYNFATVVDDIDMQISHVIRAEEHLSNTPVQVLVYEALGATMPAFAHIPFVAAPGSTEKLSKRKVDKYRTMPQFRKLFELSETVFPRLGIDQTAAVDPVMVEFYERVGFLPAGVLNALGRLGWSLDDKTEHFSLADLVANFTLERVIKGSAGFDPDKLLSYQAHWMQQQTLSQRVAGCLPWLQQAGWIANPATAAELAYVETIVEGMGERLVVAGDILRLDEFFVAPESFLWDEKAFEKRLTSKPESVALLRDFRTTLADLTTFDRQTLDTSLHAFVAARDVPVGNLVHALRVATTGKAQGIGLFEALEILGPARVLDRIDRSLARIPG